MNKKILIYLLVAIIVILGFWLLIRRQYAPGKLDGFAQCLKDKKATFYGAFWCPHCQNQKAIFGNSERLLPYVECSNPDAQSQTQVCISRGIKNYPTWEFADGSRLTGETPLEKLAEKTGCVLPQAE